VEPDRAAELIARLSDQCSKSLSQFQIWGQATKGDFKGLSPPDIAAALAGAPGASGLLVRIKYAGQYRYIDDLLSALIRAVMDDRLLELVRVPSYKKWHIPYRGFVENLCLLAIHETVSPYICLWCLGVGSIKNDAKIYQCTACRGTGRKCYSDRARAAAMHVPRGTWRYVWLNRYRAIQSFLGYWEAVALQNTARRLDI